MKFNLLASASTFAIGALAVSGLWAPAHAGLTCSAASCTETLSAATLKTDFTSDAVSLDMFNASALQTLTSVVISDNVNFSAVGNLTNTSNTSQTFIFQAGLGLSLVGGTGAPSSFPFIFASGSINPQHYTLAAGQSTPYNFSNSFASNSQTITGASNLAGFKGSSTFQVAFDGNASTSFSGGGNNIQTNLTTTATPTVTITYNFTTAAAPPVLPAPEPASMAILGTGLIGMGVMRRRQNKG